ncbi:MAG: PKD domain-containing protein, partial [Candidatus Hodarchaeota archaeon]
EWFFSTSHAEQSPPVLGDVDGDGKLEIVICSDDGNVYCIKGNGPSWAIPGPWPMFGGSAIQGSHYVDDDGDGLINNHEKSIGTNWTNPDTDADGYNDSFEIHSGTSPLNSSDAPGPVNPLAAFTFDPTSPQVNQTVNFTDQSSVGIGNITLWKWDFGDGTVNSTQQNPTHTYSSPGNFTITLEVTDTSNKTSIATRTIVVRANVNAPALNGGIVDLTLGSSNLTTFTFTVNYSDADNDEPEFIHLIINGTQYTMSKMDPLDNNYLDGCYYTCNTTLNAGAYLYVYYCSDGTFSASAGPFPSILVVDDLDGDGMPDRWEADNSLDPGTAQDRNGDPDDDDLPNYLEYHYSTDPHNPDSDGDGYSDGTEISSNTNPLDASSYPDYDDSTIIIIIIIIIGSVSGITVVAASTYINKKGKGWVKKNWGKRLTTRNDPRSRLESNLTRKNHSRSTGSVEERTAVHPSKGLDVINEGMDREIPAPQGLTCLDQIDYEFHGKRQARCMIHKGEITGMVFACNECKATYCKNCLKSMILISEPCWNCGKPFPKNLLDEN